MRWLPPPFTHQIACSGEVRAQEPGKLFVFLTACNAEVFCQGIAIVRRNSAGTGQSGCKRFLENCGDHFTVRGMAVMFANLERLIMPASVPPACWSRP